MVCTRYLSMPGFVYAPNRMEYRAQKELKCQIRSAPKTCRSSSLRRTIYFCGIESEDDRYFHIRVAKQSFIYNQIRAIVGTAAAITGGLLPSAENDLHHILFAGQFPKSAVVRHKIAACSCCTSGSDRLLIYTPILRLDAPVDAEKTAKAVHPAFTISKGLCVC